MISGVFFKFSVLLIMLLGQLSSASAADHLLLEKGIPSNDHAVSENCNVLLLGRAKRATPFVLSLNDFSEDPHKFGEIRRQLVLAEARHSPSGEASTPRDLKDLALLEKNSLVLARMDKEMERRVSPPKESIEAPGLWTTLRFTYKTAPLPDYELTSIFVERLQNVPPAFRMTALKKSLSIIPRLTLDEALAITRAFDEGRQLEAFEEVRALVINSATMYRLDVLRAQLRSVSPAVASEIQIRDRIFVVEKSLQDIVKNAPDVVADLLRYENNFADILVLSKQVSTLNLDGIKLSNAAVEGLVRAIIGKQARIQFIEKVLKEYACENIEFVKKLRRQAQRLPELLVSQVVGRMKSRYSYETLLSYTQTYRRQIDLDYAKEVASYATDPIQSDRLLRRSYYFYLDSNGGRRILTAYFDPRLQGSETPPTDILLAHGMLSNEVAEAMLYSLATHDQRSVLMKNFKDTQSVSKEYLDTINHFKPPQKWPSRKDHIANIVEIRLGWADLTVEELKKYLSFVRDTEIDGYDPFQKIKEMTFSEVFALVKKLARDAPIDGVVLSRYCEHHISSLSAAEFEQAIDFIFSIDKPVPLATNLGPTYLKTHFDTLSVPEILRFSEKFYYSTTDKDTLFEKVIAKKLGIDDIGLVFELIQKISWRYSRDSAIEKFLGAHSTSLRFEDMKRLIADISSSVTKDVIIEKLLNQRIKSLSNPEIATLISMMSSSFAADFLLGKYIRKNMESAAEDELLGLLPAINLDFVRDSQIQDIVRARIQNMSFDFFKNLMGLTESAFFKDSLIEDYLYATSARLSQIQISELLSMITSTYRQQHLKSTLAR